MHLESDITTLYCIKHDVKFKQYKRTHCLRRANTTRHPFHTFNQRRSVQSRHHQFSVYDGNITTSYCIKTPTKQQYKRTFCLSRAKAAPVPYIHSTNKDQHRVVIIVIVVCVFGQHARVRLRPHTACKSNNAFKFNHARSNANVRAVRPGPIWYPFHTFNKQRLTQTEPSTSL